MQETMEWVLKAQKGDERAFTKLVKTYQNLAFGCAYSHVGDVHHAKDIVQDTFLIAFQKLQDLKQPEMFASWLRGIIQRRCYRLFRSKLRSWDDLFENQNLESSDLCPQSVMEANQEGDLLRQTLLGLPEQQREILILYYLEEQSQQEVATFLEMSLTKVNNELHHARKKLKKGLLIMARDTFEDVRLKEEFAKNIGNIIKSNRMLADVQLKGKNQVNLFDALGVKKQEQEESELIVVQRLSSKTYRCLNIGKEISSTSSLYRSGGFSHAASQMNESLVEKAIGQFKDQSISGIVETGIKVIDLFCPIPNGGVIGFFGGDGVGKVVMMMELLERRKKIDGDITLACFVDRWQALTIQDMIEVEPAFASDLNENIQLIWMMHPNAKSAYYAKGADYLDASFYFSPLLATQKIWPALDPVYSKSKALDPKVVGERHYKVATESLQVLQKFRDLLKRGDVFEMLALESKKEASVAMQKFYEDMSDSLHGEEKEIFEKGRKLESLIAQPFYVAEEFTGKSGERWSIDQTLTACEKILNI